MCGGHDSALRSIPPRGAPLRPCLPGVFQAGHGPPKFGGMNPPDNQRRSSVENRAASISTLTASRVNRQLPTSACLPDSANDVAPAPRAANIAHAEPAAAAAPPRLLEQLRATIRVRHYSIRTEDVYADWARRFILFHGKRHPRDLGAAEVGAFLTHLAVARQVAASTQNQAKSALLFLYREVLGVQLPWLDEIVVAKDRRRLPVVLTPAEVRALLHELNGTMGLVASLLYGTGMRLLEGLRLRVKDVEFDRREVLVRDGKGGKDRVTVLPENLILPLQQQMAQARARHGRDLAEGFGEVWLPNALTLKFPAAPRAWGWQWVSQCASVGRSARRQVAAPPPERSLGAKGGGRCGAAGRHRQAVFAARVATFVRHPPAAGRLRHSHGAGAAGP